MLWVILLLIVSISWFHYFSALNLKVSSHTQKKDSIKMAEAMNVLNRLTQGMKDNQVCLFCFLWSFKLAINLSYVFKNNFRFERKLIISRQKLSRRIFKFCCCHKMAVKCIHLNEWILLLNHKWKQYSQVNTALHLR